ncbi:MAG: efflux RND transporter periplasmic adaptor subunit [Nitrosospira sp.]|nr:efflux RND transporter periplasmic adaptor subunit [Nitrosospira sp.]
MEAISQTKPAASAKRRMWITMAAILFVALVAAWVWRNQSSATDAKSRGEKTIHVVTAVIKQDNVSVRLTANGTVSPQQTVAVRPQLSAVIRSVHIKEGQFVRQGERLFTLDARTEDANLSRTEGQLAKSRSDLRNAERNLKRQRDLFQQRFISEAALEVAQNQVESLRGQLAVDEATVRATRVARGFSEILAPIAGRTGAIPVYQGSLVQPTDALVNITQIDPINVSFNLPEREFVPLQQALAKGEVIVNVELDAAGKLTRKGRLIFIDNTVDTASGTIGLKAEFPNADSHLWPGMFIKVMLAPRTLTGALTVPVQAVQNGPERKFLYVIGDNNKVSSHPVDVRLIQDGFAVIEGESIASGTRVVVEGAQNLRPGSVVTEATHNSDQARGG